MNHNPKLRKNSAFTLIELLVVLCIMSVMAGVIAISLGTDDSYSFDSNLSTLSSILQSARSYALANNTYVFVGIQEVDASVGSTNVPQVSGNGCVAIAVVASSDGTIPTSVSGSSFAPLGTSNVSAVIPLTRLNDLHIATNPPALTVSAKPQAFSDNSIVPTFLSSGAATAVPFTWPLSGSSQYSFGSNSGTPSGTSQVLVINPQGSVQILPTTASPVSPSSFYCWIEMDLQPTHGKVLPSASFSNNASIIIDGVTGTISLYH